MQITHWTTQPWTKLALITSVFILQTSCSVTPQRGCTSLDGTTELKPECCDASGGLKEDLFKYSRCSVKDAPSEVQQLIEKCKLQAIPGNGVMSGLAGGFGQGLAAIASNMELARTYLSDKEGMRTDAATDSGFVSPKGGSGDGGNAGPTPIPPKGGSNGTSPSTAAMSGGGGGVGGGGSKTAPATISDPNAQLGMVANSDAASYTSSGGGGGTRARGGSSGGGNPLSGMIQSLMGGAGGGGNAKDPNSMQRYGAQTQATAAGANVLTAGQDPEDYFTRVGPDADLFRIVEKRYEQTSLKGQLR